MKVTFKIEVAINRRKSGINGVNMCCSTEMPLSPSVGMMVVAAPGDDFREIEDVYWSQEEGVVAFLKFDDGARRCDMEDCGWTEEKLNPPRLK